MSNSTNKSSPSTKQRFYAQAEIAQTYDERRFGGASGAWVNAREIGLVSALLPPFQRALDLGCGTGRLSRALSARGSVIGMDTSSAMLAQAHPDNPAALVQGDAFAIPCAAESFDVVVALRVVFHFAEIEPLLREMTRVVAPHGSVIFDTYLWSPRAWVPFDPAHWGSGVFIHSPDQVETAARGLGWRIEQSESCFLFSPYVYRRLPLSLVRALAPVEKKLPRRLHARVFWKLKRTEP